MDRKLTDSGENLEDSNNESLQHSSDSWENIQSPNAQDDSSRHGGHASASSSGTPSQSAPKENVEMQFNSKSLNTNKDRDFKVQQEYQDISQSDASANGFKPRAIWDNLVSSIRRSIEGEKVVNEKSYLVKHQVNEYDEDEVIMPELPYPHENQLGLHEKEGGKIGSNFGFSQSKSEEEKEASTYGDAAKGLLMSFLGAGVMYGITAVLVRLAGQEGIDPIAVMFIRSVFQAIVFGATLLYKRTGWRPPPGRTIRCIWISVVYCIASISSYEAFDVIPPGSAVATRGAARTIFSIIFAFLILREGVSIGDIIGLIFCFGGIALIITSGLNSGDKDYIQPPGMGDNSTIIRIYGYTLLIISAIGRSIGHVGVRGAKEDLNTFTVVFYHSSLTVLAAGILLATVRQPTSPLSWKGVIFVAVVCIASSIATFTSNQAVKYAHPALVSFGQNADVAVSLTLEHILIARSPRPMELIGVLVIFFGLCGLTLFKWIQSKKLNSGHERLQQ